LGAPEPLPPEGGEGAPNPPWVVLGRTLLDLKKKPGGITKLAAASATRRMGLRTLVALVVVRWAVDRAARYPGDCPDWLADAVGRGGLPSIEIR